MTDVALRPLGPDQLEVLLDNDRWAFPVEHESSEVMAPGRDAVEWDRVYAAHLSDAPGEPEEVAGAYLTYTMRIPVPGGEVPAAGLSWVGVHPQFRRRGVASAMVGHHLGQAHDHGEPVSVLHAMEAPIYGRFGYGLASRQLRAVLHRGDKLRDVAGSAEVRIRFDTADQDRHRDLVGDCYNAAAATRPGMAFRDGPAMRRRPFLDPPPYRAGRERLRIMYIPPVGDEPSRGYALFARKTGDDDEAAGTLTVRELVARDPAAAHALWTRLLDLDLVRTVHAGDLAVDDPLFELLTDVRAASGTLTDRLWLRLVDLPAALQARSFSAPADVTFALTDALLPHNAGVWRLTSDGGRGRCERATGTPAFALDTRDLAAAYLGTSSFAGLAAAGLAEVHDEAGLRAADRAFSWPVAPSCSWIF